MNNLKPYIKDIPFIMLFFNGVAWFFYEVDWVQYFHAQLFGSSLIVPIFMSFYAYLHRYCLYSWVCIGSLGLLNILNLAYYWLTFPYYTAYSGIIIFTGLIFAAIKWKQTYYKSCQI